MEHPTPWSDRCGLVVDSMGEVIPMMSGISPCVRSRIIRAVNAEEAHRNIACKLREYWDDSQVDGSQVEIALRASEKSLGIEGRGE